MAARDWQKLLEPQGEWAYLLCGECPGDAELRAISDREDCSVHVVSGDKCRGERRLFAEWAKALQSPGYFGHNWDAFDECLCDLEWLPCDTVIVLFKEADRVLHAGSRTAEYLLEGLNKAASHLTNPELHELGVVNDPKLLRVVLQCSTDAAPAIRDLMAQAGINWAELGRERNRLLARAAEYAALMSAYLDCAMLEADLQREYMERWRIDREVDFSLIDPGGDAFRSAIDRGFTCIDDWPDRDDFAERRAEFRAELRVILDDLRRLLPQTLGG